MSGEENFFYEFLLNYENEESSSSDDEVYKPDDATDDEDDIDVSIDAQETTQNQSSLDLSAVMKRLEDRTRIPTSQIFVTPLPKLEDVPGSQFTLPQWELLRHQCRMHFALLCRSLKFASFCASSDTILNGILAQIYSFNEIFKSSIKATDYLNKLFSRRIFVPVIGDPKKSSIILTDQIIDHFLKGKSLDDLVEAPLFNDLLQGSPFADEGRPFIFGINNAWTLEEEELLQVAAQRFSTPAEIQKYVIPCRSIEIISEHLKKEWIHEKATPETRKGSRKRKTGANDQAPKNDQEDDQMFIIQDGMQFTDVGKLPNA
ncbi:hypothetical protein GPJ56_005781 [Histomonas meleagridis]|uniref:uncharacterized protein n=1 Tax=Histomonas meleagridis TaxID=135588 RepID=UPI00355949E3|nr:hypothetical protein GPJ56_005781 [Histomonas meleagridis]KAH0798683.1 hypothetical protein GO595_008548 [Histomonas meleagridis]